MRGAQQRTKRLTTTGRNGGTDRTLAEVEDEYFNQIKPRWPEISKLGREITLCVRFFTSQPGVDGSTTHTE